jgi:hypothetical protein
MLKTYDPNEISVIVGTHIVQGFASGTFVEVDLEDDDWVVKKGISQNTRTKRTNDIGTIVITLQKTSISNTFLSNLRSIDLTTNVPFPILVRDNLGTTLHSAEQAWIQKPAKDDHGTEPIDRVWTLTCEKLNMFNGEN